MATMNRRRMALAIVGVTGVAVFFLAIYMLSGNVGGGTSYEYATFSDVKNDRSVQSASVPEFVPASAREIVGWYHVETNMQTLEFTFAPADQDSLEKSFRLAKGGDAEEIVEKLRRFRWKTSLPSLQEAVVLSRDDTTGYKYLVINPTNKRAFYMSERQR